MQLSSYSLDPTYNNYQLGTLPLALLTVCVRRAMRFAIFAPNSFRPIDNTRKQSSYVVPLRDHQEQPETLTGLTGATLTEARARSTD